MKTICTLRDFSITSTLISVISICIQLLAAELRLAELMKKLNEEEGTISSLNRRIMLLEVSLRRLVFFLIGSLKGLSYEIDFENVDEN
jgi:hypothetical protein